MRIYRVNISEENDIGDDINKAPKILKDAFSDTNTGLYVAYLELYSDFDKEKYSTDEYFFTKGKDKSFTEQIIKLNNYNKKNDDAQYYPIVFFSLIDILDPDLIKNQRFFFFPQAINFIESNIWLHYLPYHSARNSKSFKDRTDGILDTIGKYYNQKLYFTTVAIESYKFNLRFFLNSYIKGNGKGHDLHVSPFIFHSRKEIIKKRKEIFGRDGAKTLFGEYHKDLKWRILLVDDYADIPLKTNGVSKDKTKKEIIENVLRDTFTVEVAEKSQKDKKNIPVDLNVAESELRVSIIKRISKWFKGKRCTQKEEKKEESLSTNEEVKTDECDKSRDINKSNIILESASSGNINIIWKTLIKLSTETYDIILLDYLLGARSGKDASRREYSHKLLKVIHCISEDKIGFTESNFEELKKYAPKDENKKDDDIKNIISGIKKHKGPLGHFWIFNISTFQTAFQDRLREQGLGHNSEHWVLSRGADPVNTPELFKFSLCQFMNLQFKQLLYSTDDIINFIISKPISQGTSPNIDLWASSVFGEFIYKFYAKEVLQSDRSNGSIFASSVLATFEQSEEVYRANNLTEHFRHLLYTLAFDSGLKMQVAWEELQLIKRKLDNKELKTLSSTFNNIETYISKTLNKFNH